MDKSIKDKLKYFFGANLRKAFVETSNEIIEKCSEIRIRLGSKVTLTDGEREYYTAGEYKAEKEDIKELLEMISDYSPYSFKEELKNGFITAEGGFRIGISGTAIVEDGEIRGIKGIHSVNIRICREVRGCGKTAIDRIMRGGIKNTVIISPPNCGKTTILRDIIRQISDRGVNVGVADERFEISGMHGGIIANDLGSHTDVYAGCSKSAGIMMLLRGMAPRVVCADEIWGDADVKALMSAAASGVSVICTAHGRDIADLDKREDLRKIKNIFDIAVVLSGRNGAGTIEGIYETGGGI